MVTIKQLAQEVGVSVSTVSIVLGGKATERRISEQTQKRIFDKAAEMGYQANMAARSLRGGSNQLVIAMMWAQDFRASMMIRFWDGLRHALMQQDRDIRLVIYPYTNDHLNEVCALTSASDCHAAIICNPSYADLKFMEDTQLAIPVVLYNRQCPGYCSVNVDDARMGALAARALADSGCASAAVITGPSVFEGMEVRIQGFTLEAAHCGMACPAAIYCDNSVRGSYEAVRSRLAKEWKGALPQGIFCGSSMIAHGVIRAFWDAGIHPEDMPKLVAIGNGSEDVDRASVPSLSVVHLPMEEMAAECLALLLEIMSNNVTTPRSRMLETQYIARESCGPLT